MFKVCRKGGSLHLGKQSNEGQGKPWIKVGGKAWLTVVSVCYVWCVCVATGQRDIAPLKWGSNNVVSLQQHVAK